MQSLLSFVHGPEATAHAAPFGTTTPAVSALGLGLYSVPAYVPSVPPPHAQHASRALTPFTWKPDKVPHSSCHPTPGFPSRVQ
mmetsp:Transcript_11026/g.29571  ORF Transcript_11026/g.29571 Transcript_11026/m.29571 type:complete len:83 (+) Transcript_11026:565-813(+)